MNALVPEEVKAYLETHTTFGHQTPTCKCGNVVLMPAASLEARDFWVDGEGRDWNDDPHQSDHGYYVVPGVDLVSQVDGFDPDGILLWIPALSSFGTWDSDHWDVILFENTRWEAIIADPARFLDAQWAPDHGFPYLKPWSVGFGWHEGRPF